MRRCFLFCALALACGQPAVIPDSGTPDAGAPDSGTPDAGTPTLRFILVADGGDVGSVTLYDAVGVQVSGLPPGASVALTATMAPWSSLATFTAAADGTVSTARDAPGTGSSWSGVDVDGPFWSMNTTQFAFAMSSDVAFQVLVGGEVVAMRTLQRPYFPEGVRQIAPDAGTFYGQLYVPPGSGRRPALIAFGGSEGGISGGVDSAGELLPMGYAVLAIAYFGAPGLPQNLDSIPLEYFDGVLAWLKQQPDVDPARLGVMGASRGGELALILAARYPELKAVVADVPSGYAWGRTAATDGPAWTSGGQPVPWIPWHGRMADPVTEPGGGTAYSERAVFLDDLAKSTPDQLDAGRTKVENAGASIAMFAGEADQLWPSCPMAQVAMDHLVSSGHTASHTDLLRCYPDAGHLLAPLGLPTTWSRFSPSDFGDLDLGGTPEGNAHAGRARHEEVRAFLGTTLGH